MSRARARLTRHRATILLLVALVIVLGVGGCSPIIEIIRRVAL